MFANREIESMQCLLELPPIQLVLLLFPQETFVSSIKLFLSVSLLAHNLQA